MGWYGGASIESSLVAHRRGRALLWLMAMFAFVINTSLKNVLTSAAVGDHAVAALS